MNISKRKFITGSLVSGIAGSLLASGFPLINTATAKNVDGDIPLIPTPYKLNKAVGSLHIKSGGKVTYNDPKIENIIRTFKERLRPFSVVELESEQLPGTETPRGIIHLMIGRTPEIGSVPQPLGLSPATDDDLDERYLLRSDKNGIVIRAESPE